MARTIASKVRDYSKAALAGTSEALFPATDDGSINERYVHNASAANPIAINLSGGAAALNSAGSITIAAGGSWSGGVTSAITVIGTAGQPVTAGER